MEEAFIKTAPSPICSNCGSEGSYQYTNLDDRYFGQSKGWNLKKCTNVTCQLLWLDPMPLEEEIWKAYTSYYTHTEQKKSFLDFAFLEKPYQYVQYGYHPSLSPFKKATGYLVYIFPILKNKFDFNILYIPYLNSGKVLDFGCGNGWLMDNLKAAGWNDVHGLDFDPKAIEFCKSKGLSAAVGTIVEQGYAENSFDVITINHVIEHVHDVEALLKDALNVLKKGGKLVVATPNTGSWLHRHYGKFWLHLDPPRHLHLFNNANLEAMIHKAGYKVEKSFSSNRMEAWTTIVSRAIKRKGTFKIGHEKKKPTDLLVGLFYQSLSFVFSCFNRKLGAEVIIIATKK